VLAQLVRQVLALELVEGDVEVEDGRRLLLRRAARRAEGEVPARSAACRATG